MKYAHQYAFDQYDFGVDRQLRVRAIDRHQDHKNPINIDDEEGVKLIPPLFDGFSFDGYSQDARAPSNDKPSIE